MNSKRWRNVFDGIFISFSIGYAAFVMQQMYETYRG